MKPLKFYTYDIVDSKDTDRVYYSDISSRDSARLYKKACKKKGLDVQILQTAIVEQYKLVR